MHEILQDLSLSWHRNHRFSICSHSWSGLNYQPAHTAVNAVHCQERAKMLSPEEEDEAYYQSSSLVVQYNVVQCCTWKHWSILLATVRMNQVFPKSS